MGKSTFDDLFTSRLEVAPLYMGYNSKDEEIIFYVKETGNPLHEKIQRKYQKLLERSKKNRKRNRAIMCKIVAESLLDTWVGVLDTSGETIEPTLENKIDSLFRYKKLFYEILDFAADSSNYQDDAPDDDEVDAETEEPIDPDAEVLTPEEESEKN